jgi:hypothetical protein
MDAVEPKGFVLQWQTFLANIEEAFWSITANSKARHLLHV